MGALARTAGAAVLVAALGAGYVGLDAVDVVPGVLTTAPLPPAPAPQPEPTAPAATPAPEPGPVLPALADGAADDAGLDPSAVAALLDPVLADPALGPVSASVVDAATGEVLLDRGATSARTPASTAKLVVAAAALGVLGPGRTLPTRVVAGAAAEEVVLVGGGDQLLAPGAGDPLAVDGRAGLADLADATAAALRARGTTTTALRLDDGLFDAPRTAPTWSSGDIAAGYVAPVTSLAVAAGRLEPAPNAPRAADPALAAAERLADLLRERGVTVTGDVTRAAAPPAADVLGEVTSAPVEEVVELALATSDNTVSEALAKLVARESGRATGFEDSGAAVLEAVAALGVRTAGARLVDGSGLGDGSLLPAATLTDVLRLGAAKDRPELRAVVTGLPVAGATGTLAGRYRGPATTAGAGWVRAKSGTLRGVDGLAGTVVAADGRLLVFAVLADATPQRDAAREVLDRVAAGLATCGCSGGA